MNTETNLTKRIIVKIGSSLITDNGQGLNLTALKGWTRQVYEIKQQGCEVILVSSGAVAEGMLRLGWNKRPSMIHDLQAAAAVGQMGLIRAYEDAFQTLGLHTAQILLTHDDLVNRTRYLNARSTLRTLINMDIVPIVNENDSIATDEIKFGDNDTLAALVANLIEADTLIILTDQDGLFTGDPRVSSDVVKIDIAKAGDPLLEKMATDNGSALGSGGMLTKLRAAKRAARSGTHTVIANGNKTDVLLRILAGENVGTRLKTSKPVMTARKQWLSNHLKVRGSITLDEGAIRAISLNHKSLLPIGVIAVEGDFGRGDVVTCTNKDGDIIAYGLINYNSEETHQIKGMSSERIEKTLGYVEDLELISRDNLALED
ncbi:glutamate 5-kinase [Burkholderiales bacterium]|nr:glutamate 5-kinase [Burkholderiales bacterium]